MFFLLVFFSSKHKNSQIQRIALKNATVLWKNEKRILCCAQVPLELFIPAKTMNGQVRYKERKGIDGMQYSTYGITVAPACIWTDFH
jgi:hypothetical protein